MPIYYFFLPEICFFLILMFYMLQSSVQILRQRQSFFFFRLLPYFTLSKLLKSLYVLLFLLLINPLFWSVCKSTSFGFLLVTPTIWFLKILVVFFSILIIKSSLFYIFLEKLNVKDFYFFWGFIIFFFLLFLSVNDFFLLFFNFEVISILLYLLIVFYKKFTYSFQDADILNYTKYELINDYADQQESTLFSLNILAGLVYFLYNAFFSGLYLCGLSILFIYFRSSQFMFVFYFETVKYDFIFNFFFIFMLSCFLGFFFFKLSIVPFHWWLSAVYEGSSIITLLFFAIPIKLIYFFLFSKLLFFFFSIYGFWLQNTILFCSLLSLIIGSCGLIWQQKLKKFWAFSTINHAGYLLLALSCLSFLGFRAFVIYLFSYFLTNFCFFIILQGLYNENLNSTFLYTNQLRLLFVYKNYFLGFIFSIMLFSLIGIPPLLGFWGKYLVLCALYNVYSFAVFFFFFSVILITTLIAAFVYLRLWKILYYRDETFLNVFIIPFPIFSIVSLLLCMMFFLFSFVFFFFDKFFFYIDLFFFLYFFDV